MQLSNLEIDNDSINKMYSLNDKNYLIRLHLTFLTFSNDFLVININYENVIDIYLFDWEQFNWLI